MVFRLLDQMLSFFRFLKGRYIDALISIDHIEANVARHSAIRDEFGHAGAFVQIVETASQVVIVRPHKWTLSSLYIAVLWQTDIAWSEGENFLNFVWTNVVRAESQLLASVGPLEEKTKRSQKPL